MLKILKISDMISLKVFTDAGDYFGEIEEANIVDNKVDGWRIKLSKDSNLSAYLGGARGLIVPHQFVKAIGDVVVISKNAIPVKEEMPSEQTEEPSI